ncbi:MULTISPECIES: putative quinol monooxygenase [unclassified Streptomyces]|uniref:Antibiotic biosynthesis monooxygenase n=1 Tax=Streptomyces sp. NBC_00119 TaxID=2975659 RepID=A0AAU1U0J4_9ACTN|nr:MULTISPECIES: putative quinol monooxygenase [unclassified Streptomyces]MCX4457502.1 antibiotic biosynthesis monooxygenase [Streptomyces sp. NBC_01719]MCX4496859.1 antibiotic biosynthesis monooxygenase [Streptomyces sp. NBC_01728]MCX4649184.1 antibiotic biosynthesis monooxygenase [Streptomyces sp. NBC_01446]MCX5322688.1 antibiotic biosynthesis monooxygenase [Streptomyces sp. NBC_00120]WSE02997.1 antibiotic biosynthesis monooxygenase [Streptomyces sp. NBC_01445]
MLIVIGSARALPGRRADLVSATRAVTSQTRDDQGCESYGFYADLADEDVILSLEVWRDQAALDAHMDHPHTQEFLAAAGPLIDGTPTMRFHTVAG